MGLRLRQRQLTLALLVAYLPSLLFLGHWPLQLDIPGTDFYVGLPKPGDSATHSDSGHDHARHCHEGASSCGDVPVISSATVALLHETLSIETDEASLFAPTSEWWAPHGSRTVAPEPPPPRL